MNNRKRKKSNKIYLKIYKYTSNILKRINHILGEYLDNFVILDLNNIIIYLNSEQEHKEYIKQVLKRLYKIGFKETI